MPIAEDGCAFSAVAGNPCAVLVSCCHASGYGGLVDPVLSRVATLESPPPALPILESRPPATPLPIHVTGERMRLDTPSPSAPRTGTGSLPVRLRSYVREHIECKLNMRRSRRARVRALMAFGCNGPDATVGDIPTPSTGEASEHVWTQRGAGASATAMAAGGRRLSNGAHQVRDRSSDGRVPGTPWLRRSACAALVLASIARGSSRARARALADHGDCVAADHQRRRDAVRDEPAASAPHDVARVAASGAGVEVPDVGPVVTDRSLTGHCEGVRHG